MTGQGRQQKQEGARGRGRGQFVAYEVSLEIIRRLRPLLATIGKHDRDLEKQGRRAASSIALNLKEGNRRTGKDRAYHFTVAAGSADEVVGVLEISEAWEYLSEAATRPVLALLDRQLALTWGLTHPRR